VAEPAEQRRQLAVGDEDGDEQAVARVSEALCRLPFLSAVGGTAEIGGGDDGEHPVGPGERDLHTLEEARPGRPVPLVVLDLVAGAAQLLGDPARPRPVVVCDAEEDAHSPAGPTRAPRLHRPIMPE
jgi:hypothetical protein